MPMFFAQITGPCPQRLCSLLKSLVSVLNASVLCSDHWSLSSTPMFFAQITGLCSQRLCSLLKSMVSVLNASVLCSNHWSLSSTPLFFAQGTGLCPQRLRSLLKSLVSVLNASVLCSNHWSLSSTPLFFAQITDLGPQRLHSLLKSLVSVLNAYVLCSIHWSLSSTPLFFAQITGLCPKCLCSLLKALVSVLNTSVLYSNYWSLSSTPLFIVPITVSTEEIFIFKQLWVFSACMMWPIAINPHSKQNDFCVFSGLLLQILDLNGTSYETTLESRGLHPYISHNERIIVGNPRVVQSPVGYGIRCTVNDYIIFRYPLTDPMPCPFNILECLEGITLSLWFRGEKIGSTGWRSYFRTGGDFTVYGIPREPRIDFNWYTHKGHRWWNGINFPWNEWAHLALIWNITHTVSYLNGEKYKERLRSPSTKSVVISNEIRLAGSNPAHYSLSGLRFWSGRSSPVLIWRFYQEGLTASTKNGWLLYWKH